MIEEFAIDPKCFAHADVFHLLRDLGFPKGRVLCKFPKDNWRQSIADVFIDRKISEIQKSRIEARLQQLQMDDKAIVKRTLTNYEKELSWLSNACIEHDRYPFKGIVSTSNPCSNACVVELGRAWDKGSAWLVEPSKAFKMSAPEFARITHPLLRHSMTVRFIDPYMSTTKHSALEGFKLALEAARINRSIDGRLKVEIHLRFSDKDNNKRAIDNEFGGLEKIIAFPDGTDVTLVAWPESITEEMKFHNRHVLTERGGITFGSSFNEGIANGTIDQVHLQTQPDHEFFWKAFSVPDGIPCGESKALRKDGFKVKR